jgi:hypothetical protein
MQKGELVRTSAEGNYGDKLWEGSLAMFTGEYHPTHKWPELRRLSDGVERCINPCVIERLNEEE